MSQRLFCPSASLAPFSPRPFSLCCAPPSLRPFPHRRRIRLLRCLSTRPDPTTADTTTTTTTSTSGRDMALDEDEGATPGSGRSSWWWWRRALGQRVNAAGMFWFASVASREPHLAVPHLSVPDIRWIDWEALERAGFRGVVFDKDNTLTAPYSLSLWPPIACSFQRCRATFPGKVAIFSNSAGLYQYDPDGSHAKALEDAIEGVHVVRHGAKKPSGSGKEIEKYFGCSASRLIMVGDRYFTDVVYGNRNGFLTILTEPLSISEEPFIVQQVRKLESYLVNCWYQKGMKPVEHHLVQDTKHYVNAPSP